VDAPKLLSYSVEEQELLVLMGTESRVVSITARSAWAPGVSATLVKLGGILVDMAFSLNLTQKTFSGAAEQHFAKARGRSHHELFGNRLYRGRKEPLGGRFGC
jgi:hypothetical protein